MTLKGRNYRSTKGQSYTRGKYIHGSPASRISKFTMGDTRASYDCVVSLVVQAPIQIRHNALEAARISANKVLFDILGYQVLTASNGREALTLYTEHQDEIALVLADMVMPKMDGVQVILPIRQKSPETKALMLAAALDEAMIFNSLKAGANGYLPKDSSVSDLTKAIRAVHRGELWIEHKFMSRFFDQEAIADQKGETHTGGQRRG